MKPTAAAILDVLRKAEGNWVSHAVLASVGGHRYGGRIKELRELRHEILQRGASEHSQYKLISSPPSPARYETFTCGCGEHRADYLFVHEPTRTICATCKTVVAGQERLAV